ncbi:MAG: ATP-binding protein [Planktothrix sp.]|uniref:ATP-binding protein n=2 Tax=Planktothrix sp. TaxID=3088171 RepID=UPI0038D38807
MMILHPKTVKNMNLFNQRFFPHLSPELSRLIILNIYLGIAYAIAARISISISLPGEVSPVFLPSGITLAAFLLFGSKIFPAIAFGSLIGLGNIFNLEKFFRDDLVLDISCILAGYLQPLIATFFIRKQGDIEKVFVSLKGTMVFIIAGLFSPIIAAIIMATTGLYVGFITQENYWISFFILWGASALAHLIFTPAFLMSKIHSIPGKNQIKPKNKLIIIVFILIATTLIFWLSFIKNKPIEYTLLLLLILTVFTLDKKFSIAMVAIVSSLTIVATTFGFGPFVKGLTNESLLLLQSFIGVFSVTSLILSAIIDEKQKATNQLQLTLTNLENTVKERTFELEKAKEKAEVANQAKSTFIANMSHELRSPLNAILGFSQLMVRSSNLPSDQYENAGIIYRSGDYLLTLINNILDLSKIEAGKTTLNPTNFDLYQLLDDLEDMLDLRASNAGLKLIFERSETLPRYICTDAVKLRQVLINLLSNGIKFTSQGGISLTVFEDKEDSTDVISLNFKIRDTGVGISEAELPKLFEAFTQAQAGKEAQEGTGLGLTISRKFIQLMGGDISVESELGKGTTFFFTIQVKLGQDINSKLPETRQKVLGLTPGQPTYKILTVDDKEINCKLLIKLLEPLGFELKEARNGLESITIWNEWEPHLIFMDMRMPVMDGYEATKYIKSTTKGNATAIIALTASVLEEEKAIVLSAGCDDFIRKPFTEQSIFEALAQHLGVEYIYEETQPLLNCELKFKLTSDDLNIMSQDWMCQLYEAALDADVQVVMQLITEIPNTQIFLIQSLTQLVRKFQFEQIVELVEPLISNEF